MAEKLFDIEVLYIASGKPAQHRRGMAVAAKAPGWPWSRAERGDVANPNGMRFGILRTALTLEQMRQVELRRLCVDNMNTPTHLVASPREWWVEEDPPQSFGE